MDLPQIYQLSEMLEFCRKTRENRQTIALVPTMGALHQGHLSLVEHAAQLADRVVVSIFVNPTQFAPHEDFAAYPRTLGEDAAKLAQYPAVVIFAPQTSELYPSGFQTVVANEGLGLTLCAKRRPQLFRGVCTIIAKLCNITRADFLLFGRKDFQQLRVVEQMVADLNFPCTVVGSPLVRARDGVALSSRNVFLRQEQRQEARMISQGLWRARDLFQGGERRAQPLLAAVANAIAEAPGLAVEYLWLGRWDTLEECVELSVPGIILCAVHAGTVRLIDNIELGL